MKNVALILVGLLASCGGKVTYQDDGAGGVSNNGGAGNTGNSGSGNNGSGNNGSGNSGSGNSGATADVGVGASTTNSGVTSGPGFCNSHSECGPGSLCIFQTGQCASACESFACDGCDPGTVCDSCATSSCDGCEDCRPACVPIEPGQCDDNDPCPDGQACHFVSNRCESLCGQGGQCPLDTQCIGCVTGSCCGCDDCVDLCLPFDGTEPG